MLPSVSAARPSEPSCVTPDFLRLVGHDTAGAAPVRFFPVADTYGTLRWAFVSWYAPPGGIAFVIGCDGKPVASTGTGSVEQVRSGPVVNRGATVELIVVPGAGTGISERSVELLQYRDSRIVRLWTHVSHDSWGEPLYPQRGKYSGTQTGDEAFVWSYSIDGKGIVVHGVETVTDTSESGRWRTHKTGTRENFCLRGDGFVHCQMSSHSGG